MHDIRCMQIGQVVDYIITYNERQEESERKAEKPKTRRATQADIDAFLG